MDTTNSTDSTTGSAGMEPHSEDRTTPTPTPLKLVAVLMDHYENYHPEHLVLSGDTPQRPNVDRV